MTPTQKLGRTSFVYTAANLLQRGISFFLLPVYTHYLTPDDYGILAVVTTLSGFLSIIFTWSMPPSSINRFYFDYREDPETLREFWGTMVCAMLFFSLAGCFFLLVAGPFILKPVMGDIPFWPFFTIGIVTLFFQPFFQVFLSTLQARGKSRNYAIFSISQLIIQLTLMLTLVVFLGWKAEGPLFATLVTSILFFLITLTNFKKDFTWVFRWNLFKKALRYSLPLLPHNLSAQIMVVTDKFFLNSMISASSAGIYHIGFLLGTTITIVTDSINRAYVPVAMETLEENKAHSLDELKSNGMTLIGGYCLFGTLVSLFSQEVLQLFTAEPFHSAYLIVPFVAFGFVLRGIYYVLVNILMFNKEATKWVSAGTISGALANVGLNYFLIPVYGMIGAAIATLLSQLILTIIIGKLGQPHEPFQWDYGKISLAFFFCLTFSVFISRLTWTQPLTHFLIKLTVSLFTVLALGYIVKKDFTFYFRLTMSIPQLLAKPTSAQQKD